MAQRHRRHRQRGRRLGRHGGHPHPAGAEPEAATHDSDRPLERRGRGASGLASVRQGTFRQESVQQHVRAARRRRQCCGRRNGSRDASDSTPKPEFDKFSVYFNLDNGTGKIRGVYMQGNEAVRPIFRKWLEPFREMGATTLTISNTGGTDHQSFDGIGLPGFQFIQDEIEYDTRTHHSNQDVFDRIQADDMKQASVIMAAFVYNAAMIDQKMPRKPAPSSEATAAQSPCELLPPTKCSCTILGRGPPGEPGQNPARTEPRPPEVTQSRLVDDSSLLDLRSPIPPSFKERRWGIFSRIRRR